MMSIIVLAGGMFRAALRARIVAVASLLLAGWGWADAAENSTTAVTSGALVTSTAGSIVSLPDIAITEIRSGALRAGGLVALAAPYSTIAKFDVARATLKAYRASDGVDVTATILGGNALLADPAPSASNVPDLVFSLANPSNAETGPIKLVISGVKASLAYTAAAGDFDVTLGGADTSGGGLDTLEKIDSGLGSGVTRMTLKVGAVVGVWLFVPPMVVSGPLTAQTIHVGIGMAGNDLGKPGSIFVAAIQSSGFNPTAVYFQNKAGGWERFTSCATAPAIFDGALRNMGEADIAVVPTPTDLTAFKGIDIYVGYGVSGATSPCENMLNNGTYAKYHTIR